MIVGLILQDKISSDGKTTTHCTSRRFVPVSLSIEEELGDIQWITDEKGENCWGLGNEETGWWKIIEAYEMMNPTEELHENKFPVSYQLTDHQFSELVREANERNK